MWRAIEVSLTLGVGKITKHVLQEFISGYMKSKKTGTQGPQATWHGSMEAGVQAALQKQMWDFRERERERAYKGICFSSSVAMTLNWGQEEGLHFGGMKKPLSTKVLILNPFLLCQNTETGKKPQMMVQISPCTVIHGKSRGLHALRLVPALAHPKGIAGQP